MKLFKDITVLHIEDMETYRDQMLKDLLDFGFIKTRITQAPDLAAGINYLKDNKPDMIICDWHLPDGQGIDLLEKIKLKPAFKSIPFMLCTTVDESENVMRAILAGANEYVVKPWDKETLLKKLNTVVKKID